MFVNGNHIENPYLNADPTSYWYGTNFALVLALFNVILRKLTLSRFFNGVFQAVDSTLISC